ncbi:dihydrolipoyl dehydrogenase family protein [Pseudarthrobacter sp. N5]|uniref:dihydrolipoyl dehydrogenase family protein n=1 Tax=Pseudarthrobacter sp. N5 TaxID=3418416 RepID=UPI003CE98FAB
MAAREGIIDLLVIGGGTAGIIGARTAAGLGARTVLVERARTGGDCLWTGCVPSKTILAAAAYAQIEQRLTNRPPDFAAVRQQVFGAIAAIEPGDSPAALERAGVEVLPGSARFVAPGTADIDGVRAAFRQALITAGAEPALPHIPGLDMAHVVTSETVWDLEEIPARLVIIGGGPVACELGQAFARLGSQVSVLARSQMLPKEDRDAAALIRRSLENDGVRFRENARIDRVSVQAGVSRIHLVDGTHVEADVVLLAAGRTARTLGLGLAAVGVDCDASGSVLVDAKMRTTNPAIWAAGDVTANPRFAHLAGVHASVAASNAVLGLGRRVSGTVPRVTYTSPELAAVGITAAEDGRHTISTIHHTHLDRAITEGRTDGLTRLILDRRGRIVGGTIVGPRAGESLAELTLAVQNGLSTRDIAGTTHAYPTYSDGVWNAAIADARSRLRSPVLAVVTKVLSRIRRARLDRKQGRRSGR